MSGKTILLTFTLSLLACAQPKYENVLSDSPSTPPSEKFSDCALRLKNSGYCVAWAWEQKPVGTNPGSLAFKILRPNLLDQSAMPADINTDVAIVLWMTSMGHGSTAVKVEKVDTGSYRATNVRFVMPGDWEIRFQLKNGNHIQDEAVSHITF